MVTENSFTATLSADSSKRVDHIVWSIPEDSSGYYTVEMEVLNKEGKVVSSNNTDFTVR